MLKHIINIFPGYQAVVIFCEISRSFHVNRECQYLQRSYPLVVLSRIHNSDNRGSLNFLNVNIPLFILLTESRDNVDRDTLIWPCGTQKQGDVASTTSKFANSTDARYPLDS